MEWHGAPAQGHLMYEVYPRGVETKPHDPLFENPKLDGAAPSKAMEPPQGKFYFDFREREHLYYLIGYYEEIRDMVKNREIKEHLERELGISH